MQRYIEETKRAIDSSIEAILSSQSQGACRQLLRSAVRMEGFRERPLLCRIAAECCGGNWDNVLPLAVGLELLHLSSLIADDIVDNSQERDGRPTLWKEVGTGSAVLASQLLVAEAGKLLLQAPFGSLEASRNAQDLFQSCWIDLLRGQILDVHVTGLRIDPAASLTIIRLTTGSLTEAACGVGALSSVSTTPEMVMGWRRIGRYFGVGLQLFNDATDLIGNDSTVAQFHDVQARKPRFLYMFDKSDGGHEGNWLALKDTLAARIGPCRATLRALSACRSKVDDILSSMQIVRTDLAEIIPSLMSALIRELSQSVSDLQISD